MGPYTRYLDQKMKSIDLDNRELSELLIEIPDYFRTFEEGLDEVIMEHGYLGDISDINAKTAFLKSAFKEAGVPVPKEIDRWYSDHMIIKRPTAFRLCFALNMDAEDVNYFFRRILMERSFDCHDVTELVYYYCLSHGKDYQCAETILRQVTVFKTKNRVALGKIDTVYYTDMIMKEIQDIHSDDGLISYINGNQDRFRYNNAKGTEIVQDLWNGKNGILGTRDLAKEESKIFEIDSDYGVHLAEQEKNNKLISDNDVYLAIFQFDPKSASEVFNDRSIIPILKPLHFKARDSFPSREGLTKILNNRIVNYETIRKMIIFLSFYNYWANWKLKNKGSIAEKDSQKRYEIQLDDYLLGAGFESPYLGNPYDFIFLFCNKQEDPLWTFRFIMGELLTEADKILG